MAVDDDAIRVSVRPTDGAEGAFNSSAARIGGIAEGTPTISFRIEVLERVRLPRGVIRVALDSLPSEADSDFGPLVCTNAVADFDSTDPATSKTVTCSVVDDSIARGFRVAARVTATISLPGIVSDADQIAALTALVTPPTAEDHAGIAPSFSASSPWKRTMTVYIEDNDVSGISVFGLSPTPALSQRTGLAAGVTHETPILNSVGTFEASVGLTSQPTAPVTLRFRFTSGLATDDDSDAFAAAQSLLSVVGNVTVLPERFATGGTLRLSAGTLPAGTRERFFAVAIEALSSDPNYNLARGQQSVIVSIFDPSAPVLVVAPVATSVSEGFTSTVATVRLSVDPLSTITVLPALVAPAWARDATDAVAAFLPTDPAPLVVATPSLVFTSSNWRTPQNVRVTANDINTPLPNPTQAFGVTLPIVVASAGGPFKASGTDYFPTTLSVAFGQSERALITYIDVSARFAAGAAGNEPGTTIGLQQGLPAPSLTLTEDNAYVGPEFTRMKDVFGGDAAAGIGDGSFRVFEASVAAEPAAPFTLRLSSPSTLLSSGAAEVVAAGGAQASGTAGATFRFTAGNFATARPLFLLRVANRVAHTQPDLLGELRFSVDQSPSTDDLAYRQARTVGALSVTVTDDDSAGVRVERTTAASVSIGSEVSQAVTFSAALRSQPQSGVTIGVEAVGLPAACSPFTACVTVARLGSPGSSGSGAESSGLQAGFTEANWANAESFQVAMTANGHAFLSTSGISAVALRFFIASTSDPAYEALQASTAGGGVSRDIVRVGQLPAVALSLIKTSDLRRNGLGNASLVLTLPSGIAFGKTVAVDIDIMVASSSRLVAASAFGLRVPGTGAAAEGRPASPAKASLRTLYAVSSSQQQVRYTFIAGGTSATFALEVFAVDHNSLLEDYATVIRVNASVSESLTLSQRYSGAVASGNADVLNKEATLNVLGPLSTPTPTPTSTATPTPTQTATMTPTVTPTASVTASPTNTPTSSVSPTPSATTTQSAGPTPSVSSSPSPSVPPVGKQRQYVVRASLTFTSSATVDELRANSIFSLALRQTIAGSLTRELSGIAPKSALVRRSLQVIAGAVGAEDVVIADWRSASNSTVEALLELATGNITAAELLKAALQEASSSGRLNSELLAVPALAALITSNITTSRVRVDAVLVDVPSAEQDEGVVQPTDATAPHTGAIIGAAVGAVLLVVAVSGWYAYSRREQKRRALLSGRAGVLQLHGAGAGNRAAVRDLHGTVLDAAGRVIPAGKRRKIPARARALGTMSQQSPLYRAGALPQRSAALESLSSSANRELQFSHFNRMIENPSKIKR